MSSQVTLYLFEKYSLEKKIENKQNNFQYSEGVGYCNSTSKNIIKIN